MEKISEVNSPAPTRTKLLGLVSRRERWGLSLRGWLVLLAGGGTLAVVFIFNIQPFLAPTERVDSKILVVEGWVKPYAIDEAVKEFRGGHYDKVFATGGPVPGSGGVYINDFNTLASVGADLLVSHGLAREVVQMVPSHVSGRDRTYSSALALREYFQTNGLAVKSFNLVTEDVHARRSRLLFQKAFGPDVKVGIIAAPNPDYDSARWWRYSEGVREILGESIAYLYAAFVFHPAPARN